MPEKETLERAQEDAAEGKSPSTQAGEFVREEMHHIREGKHGARSTKQAIAIGLSKARRAGVELNPPSGPPDTRKKAASDVRAGKSHRKPSAPRARAVRKALRREGRSAASRSSLARQARSSARRRGAAARSRSGRKAAATRSRRRR
ncbi:MAG: transcription elongation factor [Acidobacteria bacterium]|nr:MAG: transcription elongation factor [Acidobacteriota bacterium]